MREEFKAFYNANDDELQEIWNSENTLFVFDTNVLLNLYGYAENTRNDFFKILDCLREQLWIPYHVGIEYQRRRLEIVKTEKSTFSEIEKNLVKIQDIFKKDFEKLALKRRFPKLSESTEKLESEIKKSIVNYRKSVTHWNTNQPDVRSEDKIREKIDTFFENKIGEKPEGQEWLDSIVTEGKVRFEKKIPPGFGDTNKSKDPNESFFIFNSLNYERQYGDLIIWKQLIEKAKDDDIQNIIFITDDAKEDWWQIIDSKGKKQIGALPELSAEIHRESDVKNFHMYSTSLFMEDGRKQLEIELDESSIEDASHHYNLIQQSLFSDQKNSNLLSNIRPYNKFLRRLDELEKELNEQLLYLNNRIENISLNMKNCDDFMDYEALSNNLNLYRANKKGIYEKLESISKKRNTLLDIENKEPVHEESNTFDDPSNVDTLFPF